MSIVIVGEWGWGVEGKQVGSMDEESQVRGDDDELMLNVLRCHLTY